MNQLIKIGDTKNATVITSSEVEFVITSREIAELTGKRHDNVMRDIRVLLEQGVQALNFEESFIIRELPNGGSKQESIYNLNKKGCLILASGYDALLREQIIDRLEYLEEELKARIAAQAEWNTARAIGKGYRKGFTDAMKVLVNYSYENGSRSAEKYYMIYTNLFNKLVDIKHREDATKEQLSSIMLFEFKITNLIYANISRGTHYKEIYRKTKEYLEEFKKFDTKHLTM